MPLSGPRSLPPADGYSSARQNALPVHCNALAGFPGNGGDFRRQQAHDDPVFIGRPRRTVETQERSARALFPAETKAAVEQTVNKPFEANRHFYQLASQIIHHAVNHRGRDQRFTDSHVFAPQRTMLEQIVNGDRQIMVRVHQPCRRHDAMTVVVRVVGEGQSNLSRSASKPAIAHLSEQSIRIAPSLSRHKAEGLINLIVN